MKFIQSLLWVIFTVSLSALVHGANITYIYDNPLLINEDLVATLEDGGHKVTMAEASSFSGEEGFDAILIGDENLRETIDIRRYHSIIANHYHGTQWGLVNDNGISWISSSAPLGVLIPPSEDQVIVHTQGATLEGIGIPYYYLADKNKPLITHPIAITIPTSSGETVTGEVVSFLGRGTILADGTKAKGNICFFGILSTDYWTQEAKNLFLECAENTLRNSPNQTDYDLDGRNDSFDNCPDDYNPLQEDLDLDGIGNACDSDIDGDEIGNAVDICPLVPDPLQLDADKDGKGDECEDECEDGIDNDSDGVIDALDPGCRKGGESILDPECQDGIDNDLDGQIDMEDSGCSSPIGASEGDRDRDAPLLTIISPAQKDQYALPIRVAILAQDEHLDRCSYRIDSGIDITFNCFETNLTALSKGNHTLTVTAKDTYGNTNSTMMPLSYQPLELTILSFWPDLSTYEIPFQGASCGSIISPSRIPITLKAVLMTGQKETILNLTQTNATGPVNFTYKVPSSLPEGRHSIVILGTDVLGGSAMVLVDRFDIVSPPPAKNTRNSGSGGGGGNHGGEIIAACNNKIDDDHDGKVDLDDPGCENKGDFDESESPAIVPEVNISSSCRELWSCDGWSICIDGYQERTCDDMNSCGTLQNKPLESMECQIDEVGSLSKVANVANTTGSEMTATGLTGAVVGSATKDCKAFGKDYGSFAGLCWYVHLLIIMFILLAGTIFLMGWKRRKSKKP